MSAWEVGSPRDIISSSVTWLVTLGKLLDCLMPQFLFAEIVKSNAASSFSVHLIWMLLGFIASYALNLSK